MNTSDDSIAIDRLIDGELDEHERRELLLRLDTMPDGWRRCALAFLEAREFAHSARVWTCEHAPARTEIVPVEIHPRRKRTGLFRIAVAATVAGLAFASGFATGERNGAQTVVDHKPSPVEPAPSPSPLPNETASPLALARRDAALAVPEYVRSILQRSGYQVEPARKLVSLSLDGGRRVTVPVVQIQYVGRQTY